MREQTGKITYPFFGKFIKNKCGQIRQEVKIGPQFGVDVSIVDLPKHQAIAMASDPLSLIPSLGLKESAWLSVQLTANDIATTGFAPLYGQFILNLPARFSHKDFQIYWDHIHRFCSEIGMAITGGHTGFVEGQNATVSGGATFMTIAPRARMLTSKFAKPGDAILATKSCALSSTAILAMSFPATVKDKAGLENYQRACASFYDISVLKDALTATNTKDRGEISAMHDVTEGGILGAAYEMAKASGQGAVIYNDKLPIDETRSAVCKAFSLDPRYCTGAGSMILACKKEAVQNIISRLAKEHIPCKEIGEITVERKGIQLNEKGKETNIIYHEKDPYWEAFFKALKSGWK